MVVRLDPALYLPEAVTAAIQAFATHAAITQDSFDQALLSITVDGDARTVDEFLNYTLVASLELHLTRP